jgi:hypothetical protein
VCAAQVVLQAGCQTNILDIIRIAMQHNLYLLLLTFILWHKEPLELFGCFWGIKQHLFGVFKGQYYGRTFLEFSGALSSQKYAVSGA